MLIIRQIKALRTIFGGLKLDYTYNIELCYISMIELISQNDINSLLFASIPATIRKSGSAHAPFMVLPDFE